ncbi:hypothetical protein [Citrobacter farmeri]|uniref:hypothetical protein n=1 Tax=Citrobacter farmeri TaxID=67824 RepID=UPI00397CC96E
MKRIFLGLVIFVLSGCTSRPYVPTDIVYDSSFLNSKTGATKVRVHRVQQLSGSGLGDSCPLVLKIDEKEVAGLQQNQYVDVYLPNGEHTLSVRFKCALTKWRKSLSIIANGHYQEYQTETGAAGQYRLWQVK